jgi:hypothetical protein
MKPFCSGRDDRVGEEKDKVGGGKRKRQSRSSAVSLLWLAKASGSLDAQSLLGGEFFLFAFHAHLFELALFGFDRGGDFLLDLGGCFFQLW